MKTSATLSRNNLIWIDLEMTGLLPDRDRIIEIATIVTDSDLNVLAQGPVLAITQSAEQLASMDDWNRTTHGETGLISRVELSTLSEQEAEQKTLQFLMQWVPKNCSPLCGNSIGHDRQFLLRYMPTLAAYFHYRAIDVSTLKELAKRWRPDILSEFKKQATHKALDDIKESIAELAYYRQHFIQTE